MGMGGTLQLSFDAAPWNSKISFAPNIPVTLSGGVLDLKFAAGVDVGKQVGRTIDAFDWTDVNPTGSFTVTSLYHWDLSKLYTTGNITLLSIPTVAGDFDRDAQLTSSDISSMMQALSDLNGFKSAHGMSDADLLAIGDLNHDGSFNNADVQSLLGLLKSGAGSVATVPELPTGQLLLMALAVGGIVSLRRSRRQRASSSHMRVLIEGNQVSQPSR